MSEQHQIENALNIEYLSAGFITAIQKAWCYDTCWDGCKDRYFAQNPDLNPATDARITGQTNPSFGNCLVTTLAAAADMYFNAEILPSLVHEAGKDQPTWHFFLSLNTMGWVDIDPTRQQFSADAEVEVLEKYHPMRNEVLYGSLFETQENERLRARLALLLNRMEQNGYGLRFDADEIVDRVQKTFAEARYFGHKPVTQQDKTAVLAVTAFTPK